MGKREGVRSAKSYKTRASSREWKQAQVQTKVCRARGTVLPRGPDVFLAERERVFLSGLVCFSAIGGFLVHRVIVTVVEKRAAKGLAQLCYQGPVEERGGHVENTDGPGSRAAQAEIAVPDASDCGVSESVNKG
jgi:hypothetical protein